jgi:hypothetical protein
MAAQRVEHRLDRLQQHSIRLAKVRIFVAFDSDGKGVQRQSTQAPSGEPQKVICSIKA